MIEQIRISHLGVIEDSTLDLGPGLTVISGETGAGKTMVVTALALLLGGRSDSGAVRAGARAARVEGDWRLSDERTRELRALIEDVDAEIEEDDEGEDVVVVARSIAVGSGRSRAFVGGASVPASRLADVGQSLVAVHGQSDQHRLLSTTAQRHALDRFAGSKHATQLTAFGDRYARLRAAQAELAEVRATLAERSREAEMLRFGLSEIERVAPQLGEEDDLAAEESRLGYADELRRAAEAARGHLSDESGGTDAHQLLTAASAALEAVRDHDTRAGELADRAKELGYLAADLATDVAAYSSGIESDPQRLAAVSERRAEIIGLMRKYGATTHEVLAWSEKASERLASLDHTDERIADLEDEIASLRTELADLAGSLSASRAEAATRLSARVTDELTDLAMPHARLEITTTRAAVAPESDDGLQVAGEWVRMTREGIDDVEFGLAANTGAESRPLRKGASGGELSRVMLGLEVALADTDPVPVFVFDEVDAGVGGAAAVEIGRRLAVLARHAQVLVVTHLPQVAAFADAHVVVAKHDDGSVTASGLQLLDDTGRRRELSRMLAGQEESESANAHAAELLELARSSRALG